MSTTEHEEELCEMALTERDLIGERLDRLGRLVSLVVRREDLDAAYEPLRNTSGTLQILIEHLEGQLR